MSQIVLASKSPYRAALLKRWKMDFIQEASSINEDEYKARISDPVELVEKLSLAKAQDIQIKHPKATIIGSDQILLCEGKVYGKAGSKEKALEQLMALSGKEQELVTGLVVLKGDETKATTHSTKIKFRRFTKAEAERSLEIDSAWDCAGSMKIEGTATWLIESLETTDPSSIEGLPLIKLGEFLRQLGHNL